MVKLRYSEPRWYLGTSKPLFKRASQPSFHSKPLFSFNMVPLPKVSDHKEILDFPRTTKPHAYHPAPRPYICIHTPQHAQSNYLNLNISFYSRPLLYYFPQLCSTLSIMPEMFRPTFPLPFSPSWNLCLVGACQSYRHKKYPYSLCAAGNAIQGFVLGWPGWRRDICPTPREHLNSLQPCSSFPSLQLNIPP